MESINASQKRVRQPRVKKDRSDSQIARDKAKMQALRDRKQAKKDGIIGDPLNTSAVDIQIDPLNQ